MDKIIEVNGRKISSQEQLIAEINADEDFIYSFTVIRNQGEVKIENVQM